MLSMRWVLTSSMLVAWIAISGCSHSPSRQQADQMRLARQADLNYQSGKFDLARKQYESLLELNPKFSVGFVRLGVIAYRAGEVDVARNNFEAALRADPRNTQATYNLAMLHLNDAARLLDTYMNVTPPAAQREEVRMLVAQLRTFSGKQ